MLFNPETFEPLCAATQAFVNAATPTSTVEVEGAFIDAVAPLLREVVFPDGKRVDPRFTKIEPEHVSNYVQLQGDLRHRLTKIAQLPQRAKFPRLWAQAAEPLRAELGPTLQRLLFLTTVDFGTDGALRLYPLSFGIETTTFSTLAALLEPDTPGRVVLCGCGCKALIVHPGSGPGQPPSHLPGHAQYKRNRKRRRQRS